MAQINWDGSLNNTWDGAANWVGGVAPVDGDSVVFLAADLVGVACAVGPAAAVTLLSISDDAGYSGVAGAGSEICYALITVTTVNCLSATFIAGGTIQTANLTANGTRIVQATIDTSNLSGGNTCRIFSGTHGTVNLSNLSYVHGAGSVVGVVNIDGDGCYIDDGTFTAVNMNADLAEVWSNTNATTVHVFGNACEVSGNAIAAGQIANGPYIWNRDCVLGDSDIAGPPVIMNANWTEPYAAGAW